MSTVELALTGQVLLWLVILGVFMASGQASIFHPLGIYLGFHGLVFVLRPLLVQLLGFDSEWIFMGFKPEPEEFIRTLAATSLGLVVLATTCLSVGRARPRFSAGVAPSLSHEQGRALVVITILLLPYIAYSIYKANGDTGGMHADNGVYMLTKSTGYVNDAQLMLAPLLCLWLVKTRFHWLNLVPILIYVGYRAWCGWARWTILLFFVTLVFQFCWYHRSRWLPVWTFAAAVPVLILFNLLGHNRDMLKALLIDGTVAIEQFRHPPGMSGEEKRRAQLDTQDFANFDYLAAVVSIVPRRTGTYTYGTQYLQLFTEPIPRILWHGKPAGAPVSFFGLGQYVNFMGLTISMIGDGWMNGGWIGVVITMGLVGAVLGWAHRTFWAKSNLVLPSMFYLTLLGVSPNWFRDGGVISLLKFLLFTWMPLLLLPVVVWLMKGRVVAGNSIHLRPGEPLRLVRTEPGHVCRGNP